MSRQAVFFGLTTLDVVHFLPSALGRNEKVFDQASFVGAGGPATNAAMTFAALGGSATLLSAIGNHPVASLIDAELRQFGVRHVDLSSDRTSSPPVASVLVSLDNGDRSVASSADPAASAQLRRVSLPKTDVLLVDGHEGETAVEIAAAAQRRKIPVVLDGGSWKKTSLELLRKVDFALISERFNPPELGSLDLFEFIHRLGVPNVAQTRGAAPILFSAGRDRGTLPVPKITALDTLAAGDIFHGAFCFGLVTGRSFIEALRLGAEVAAESCRYLGPRQWAVHRSAANPSTAGELNLPFDP